MQKWLLGEKNYISTAMEEMGLHVKKKTREDIFNFTVKACLYLKVRHFQQLGLVIFHDNNAKEQKVLHFFRMYTVF